MAQRLSSEERARVEVMTAAGVGVKETAWRLGRHCSTVYRELARSCGTGGYDAQAAQTAADGRSRRPKTPVLAADPVLAAATAEPAHRSPVSSRGLSGAARRGTLGERGDALSGLL